MPHRIDQAEWLRQRAAASAATPEPTPETAPVPPPVVEAAPVATAVTPTPAPRAPDPPAAPIAPRVAPAAAPPPAAPPTLAPLGSVAPRGPVAQPAAPLPPPRPMHTAPPPAFRAPPGAQDRVAISPRAPHDPRVGAPAGGDFGVRRAAGPVGTGLAAPPPGPKLYVDPHVVTGASGPAAAPVHTRAVGAGSAPDLAALGPRTVVAPTVVGLPGKGVEIAPKLPRKADPRIAIRPPDRR